MSLINIQTSDLNSLRHRCVCLACNAWFFSQKETDEEAERELTELIRVHAKMHLDASGLVKDNERVQQPSGQEGK